jgi:hypothetical protein
MATRWAALPGLLRNNLVCARALFTLSYLVFHLLPIRKRRIAATCLDFGVMNEQVLASIIWSNEAVTFSRIKPLNRTSTHLGISSLNMSKMIGPAIGIAAHTPIVLYFRS